MPTSRAICLNLGLHLSPSSEKSMFQATHAQRYPNFFVCRADIATHLNCSVPCRPDTVILFCSTRLKPCLFGGCSNPKSRTWSVCTRDGLVISDLAHDQAVPTFVKLNAIKLPNSSLTSPSAVLSPGFKGLQRKGCLSSIELQRLRYFNPTTHNYD